MTCQKIMNLHLYIYLQYCEASQEANLTESVKENRYFKNLTMTTTEIYTQNHDIALLHACLLLVNQTIDKSNVHKFSQAKSCKWA